MTDTINQVGAGAPAPMNPQFTTVVIRDAKDPIQLGNLLLGGVISAAATGNLVEEQFQREADAPAAPVVQAEQQPVRYREADRVRFPDPAFNKWLDESISDSWHTVWDQIGDTADAWSGWENRQYYAAVVAQAAPSQPEQSGLMDALERIIAADWSCEPYATDRDVSQLKGDLIREIKSIARAALSTQGAKP